MNPIERIRDMILERFPMAKMEMDPAENKNGSWFLDVSLGEYQLNIEFHRKKGIGLTSNPLSGYGEGVDEVYTDTSEAERRVIELLLSQTETNSPLSLRQIREYRGYTQTDVSKMLGTSQASVARFEKRSNPQFSTLYDVVEAIGGSLSILVTFPNEQQKELDLSRSVAKHGRNGKVK